MRKLVSDVSGVECLSKEYAHTYLHTYTNAYITWHCIAFRSVPFHSIPSHHIPLHTYPPVKLDFDVEKPSVWPDPFPATIGLNDWLSTCLCVVSPEGLPGTLGLGTDDFQ